MLIELFSTASQKKMQGIKPNTLEPSRKMQGSESRMPRAAIVTCSVRPGCSTRRRRLPSAYLPRRAAATSGSFRVRPCRIHSAAFWHDAQRGRHHAAEGARPARCSIGSGEEGAAERPPRPPKANFERSLASCERNPADIIALCRVANPAGPRVEPEFHLRIVKRRHFGRNAPNMGEFRE